MMRKRLAAGMTAVALLGTILTGCTSESSAEGSNSQTTAATTSTAESQTDAIDENWPDGTVYVYIGAKAGGGSDTIMRIYTQFFEDYTGEKFTVVNDTTGQGSVVYENEIDADPDGMNLLFGSTASYVSYFNGQISAPLNDKNALTLLGVLSCPIETESDNILIVRKDAPYDTLEEYIQYSKDHPGEVSFGIQNGGGSQYIAAMLENIIGTQVKYVEAGSVADKLVSLVGGNIDACVVYPKQAAQYMETGDVKALAVLGENRSSITPDVPSLVEKGFDPIGMGQYQAVFGPANMDPATVNAISTMIQAANEDPEVVAQVEAQGFGCRKFTIEEGYEVLDQQYADYTEVQKLIDAAK